MTKQDDPMAVLAKWRPHINRLVSTRRGEVELWDALAASIAAHDLSIRQNEADQRRIEAARKALELGEPDVAFDALGAAQEDSDDMA